MQEETMHNIKDILAVQGFRNDDLVRFGIKDATMPNGHNWKQSSYSIDRIIRELANQSNHLNYYISHAKHSGGNFTKKNFSEIVEMVIDIDYGPYHNKPSEYDTKQEALAAAIKLPKPTLVIHTGGGLQVHYRFRNRLKLPEHQKRFEEVTERLEKHIGADSCYATGHTFRLAFTKNHKAGAPVRDVEIEEINENIDYTLEELEQWCTDHGVKKYTKTIIKTKKRNRKMKRKKKSPGRDRSALAFKEIERIIRKHPELREKEVYNHLKDKLLFNHYVAKGGRELARKYFKRDFKRCKYKLTNARIPTPPNEVVKLKYTHGITEELNTTRNLFYSKVFAPTTPSLDISLSLMEELYLSGEKSILNFPCASGKTTAAMILAANYASPKNRMWIVTQKVKDVKEIAKQLRKIGANALEWHGWNSKCPIPREEFMKKKAKESCSACPKKCTAHHKYLSKTPWDNEDCDILVTTHSHWQATVSNEKFSPSLKFVIVDEAPGLMEYFTIDDKVKKDILSLFQYDAKLSKTFKTDIDKAIDTCDDGGCHKIASFNCLRKRNEINQYIHKLQEKEEEKEEEKISSELLGVVKSFINFFNTEEIYGMTQRLNWKDKTTFIRGEVDLRTNVPHMVLDGSALMNDVYWEGFKIYESDDLKQKYPNTTIDVVDDNPSKTKLRTRKSFDSLLQKVKEAIEKHPSVLQDKDPVVIFSNKELSNDKELLDNIEMLHKMVNEMGLPLIDMFRGEHIGSNRAQKAVLCAVGMSLFNDISYYVLRTALVTHSEIDAERIWKKVFGSPNMRNGGFVDFDIQQTYCRAVVVDLYQTIMRGCVRLNPEAHYNVVCVLSGPEIFQILSNELDGATFNYEHSEVVKALLQGKSDTEILEEHNIKRNCLTTLKATLNLS